jgi:hypothetical protein
VHDYHEGQPGYSEAQILHDGCGECEARGKDVAQAISSMDKGRFVKAWQRAAEWNTKGVPDIAKAEMGVLHVLWVIQIKLESRGIAIGEVPSGF